MFTGSSCDNSSPLLFKTSNSDEIYSHKVPVSIGAQTNENLEDFCREVRCIESAESMMSKCVDSSPLSLEANRKTLPLIGDESAESTNQELVSRFPNRDRQPRNAYPDFPLHSLREPSAWHGTDDGSECENLNLNESISCQASNISSVPSSWHQNVERDEAEHENKYSDRYAEEFIGKLQDAQRQISSLRFDVDCEIISQKSSENSTGSITYDGPQAPNTNALTNRNTANVDASIAETKALEKCDKEPVDSLVADTFLEAKQPVKNVKDVGLDPLDDWGTMQWASDFKKLQREIIVLWHSCNIHLVYRTYFFLIFKDDPADNIYLEVERRRLSSINDAFSWGTETVLDGQTITPGSSLKSLRQEREMLSKLMKKRLSKQDRKNLYVEWGIDLGSKNRSLQLANCLWTDNEDMDHITRSANVIGKLVRLDNQRACKEMFGLNLMPRQRRRKLYGWKLSLNLPL
ncbi:hypothetical protein Nepgr_008369 [Nepenthes gracilis]|uniref:NPK1-activating kinesin-like protein C-terminal domain-containing protein n=1 Tax=Nepenthes gracilis TaxID=150966 RepID=A0AAD3S8W1_NEPGR|nr:hypothetical protein Nepgr_008369 [Nepenthes gracilis]